MEFEFDGTQAVHKNVTAKSLFLKFYHTLALIVTLGAPVITLQGYDHIVPATYLIACQEHVAICIGNQDKRSLANAQGILSEHQRTLSEFVLTFLVSIINQESAYSARFQLTGIQFHLTAKQTTYSPSARLHTAFFSLNDTALGIEQRRCLTGAL